MKNLTEARKRFTLLLFFFLKGGKNYYWTIIEAHFFFATTKISWHLILCQIRLALLYFYLLVVVVVEVAPKKILSSSSRNKNPTTNPKRMARNKFSPEMTFLFCSEHEAPPWCPSCNSFGVIFFALGRKEHVCCWFGLLISPRLPSGPHWVRKARSWFGVVVVNVDDDESTATAQRRLKKEVGVKRRSIFWFDFEKKFFLFVCKKKHCWRWK